MRRQSGLSSRGLPPSPNLTVTAGVRSSQERERLDPLTNSVQDSQAVYVGTQIKF